MTAAELADQLRPGATVVLDSNAVWGSRLLALADKVNLVNQKQPAGAQIILCVPALVHAEHLAQLRRRLGDGFKPSEPRQILERKGVAVLHFTDEDAELAAGILARWFPSQDVWRLAKAGRLARALGVPCPSPAPRVPATLDWYLACQSEGRDWLMITDDQDQEFEKVSRRASLAMLRDALSLLSA